MNKKILFTAAVAAAAFSACTSEDALESVANKPAAEAAEVVGAKLAGTGIVANITTDDEAITRVTAAGWQKTDKIGLAWVNNGTTDITLPQGSALATTFSDRVLYANTILNTEDNGKTFKSMANVYEGAYFMYSPWAYVGQAQALEFAPNATKQVKAVDTERYEKLPWISGLQFIAADDDIEEGNVTVDFKLNPIANTLRFVTTPEPNVTTALKDYVISRVTVKECAHPVWYETLTVDPQELADNADDLDKAIKNMVAGGPNTNITTLVDPTYENASLAGEGEFRIFALPTESGVVAPTATLAGEWLVFEFEVSDKDGNVIGYFNIDPNQMDPAVPATYSEKNTGAAQKLLEALMNPSALFAKSITQILRNNGKPAALKLPMELRVQDLKVTLFDEISDIDEWNLAVELFDALHKGETDAEANFTVDGVVEFTDSISWPRTAKVLNVKSNGCAPSTFAGKGEKAVMPKIIKGAAAYPNNFKIVVLNDSELEVISNSSVSGVGYVAIGTTAAAATDDTTTELDETVPGRVIATQPTAGIFAYGNNGEIIVKDSAVKPNDAGTDVVRPEIQLATGVIIYEVEDEDFNDAVNTNKGAYTNAMFNHASWNNANVLRVNGKTATLNNSSYALTAAALELNGANIVNNDAASVLDVASIATTGTSTIKAETVKVGSDVVVKGDLTVTIKTQAFDSSNNIKGATASGNKLTVKGQGVVKGQKVQNADSKITVTIEDDVTNNMN